MWNRIRCWLNLTQLSESGHRLPPGCYNTQSLSCFYVHSCFTFTLLPSIFYFSLTVFSNLHLILCQYFPIFLIGVLLVQFLIFVYSNFSFMLATFHIKISVLHFLTSRQLSSLCLPFLRTEDSFLYFFPFLILLVCKFIISSMLYLFFDFWNTIL
jgi:hypothetical protein